MKAFVHTDLPYDIYMKMPPGFTEGDMVMKLKKALYGLRESPLLWQKDFTTTLRDVGFEPVPHEPCCWIRTGVIVFFYVDDIVIAYRKGKEAEARQATEALKKKYSLQGGGNLQWFLGVAVIRDRAKKTIWLSQTDLIAKMERFLNPEKRRRRHRSPMGLTELLPYEETAQYGEVTRY